MAQDALSQILNLLRLQGTVYFHTHFNEPWGVRVPELGKVARFHMAMRGNCWLRVEGHPEPIQMATGDLVVIPHGTPHILSDTNQREAIDVDEVIQRTGYPGHGALVYGGDDDGAACKLVCGHFQFEEGFMHPILDALPNYIHVTNAQTMNASWLESVMRFVSAEVMGNKAGSDAIVHRLSEIFFIQVIRAFVDEAGESAGSLAGVLNPQIGNCLSKIHSTPEEPWTVEAMAIEAGMSRTIFAERFTASMGLTPLGYLTHWRMQLARRELAETDHTLIEIAERVGYGSEASFNRAFKRQFDVTPGEMRRTAHAL